MTTAANLVHQHSTSTGNGYFVLNSVTARRPFADAFGTGGSDMFFYFITHRSAEEWEIGTGHMADAVTLVRDTVIASSTGSTRVAFSAGDKDVINDIAAERQLVLPPAPVAGDLLMYDGARWAALPRGDAGTVLWAGTETPVWAVPQVAQIDGLESALSAAAPAVHGHAMTDIDGLDDALTAKAAAAHAHTVDDITDLTAALSAKAAASHTHDISAVTGLDDALGDKAPAARNIATSGSLTGGGTLGADRTLSLQGDAATPDALHYYGTDGSGDKGFHALPTPPVPAATDVAFSSGGHKIITGADVAAALTAVDAQLARGGFHARLNIEYNHFTANADRGPFAPTVSGTAANGHTAEGDSALNTDAQGVIRMATGTTATGSALRSLGTQGMMLHRAGKTLRLATRLRLPTLTASGTQEFRVWGGISIGTAANTNPNTVFGLCWYYDKNNANWQLLRRAGSVTDTVDSGITVAADTWYDMELTIHGAVDDADVTATLSINGTACATIDTLTSGVVYNVMSCAIQKLVGTQTRYAYLDYEALMLERTP